MPAPFATGTPASSAVTTLLAFGDAFLRHVVIRIAAHAVVPGAISGAQRALRPRSAANQ